MRRRYVISKNKQSNWFTDLFNGKDTKLIEQFVDKLRKTGINADKNNIKLFEKNGQKFINANGDIYIMTDNLSKLTNDQCEKMNDFLNNFRKFIKLNEKSYDPSNIENYITNITNNPIKLDNDKISLIKIS